MFKSIRLTNFRKHESLALAFDPQLVVIRSANEAGKTTILEAIAYALFGVKGLREGLEAVVTWDKPASSLKVELVFDVGGVEYTMTRGKSGAELRYEGGSVTGQTETTNFIAKLLGTDPATAPKLTMANQGEIRGALSAGAKATADLIERLSGFEQFDEIVDLIQSRLVTGSPAQAEAALQAAQSQLDNLPVLQEPDWAALDAAVDGAQGAVTGKEAVVGALREQVKERRSALSAARQANEERRAALVRFTTQDAQFRALHAELGNLQAPPQPNGTATLDELTACIREAEAGLAAKPAYEAVKPLLGAHDSPFPGTASALEAEVDRLRAEAQAHTKAAAEQRTVAARAEALVIAGSCSLCGKDVSEVPEVVEKNARLQAQVAAAVAAQDAASRKAAACEVEAAGLTAVRAKAKMWLDAARRYADHLTVDASTVPPTLSWNGPTDFSEVEQTLRAAEAERRELQERRRALDVYQAKYDDLQGRIARAEAACKAAEAAASALVEVDEAGLVGAVEAAEAQLDAARNELDTLRLAAQQAAQVRQTRRSEWTRANELREGLQEAVTQRRAELKQLNFNNALLKAVRAARPVIADRLWSLVLGAVSRYFSEMRGVKSVVTKAADGFRVDGRPATSLSGSTLDILGLAVRLALVRTFMPNAATLVLDEPSAAMDEQRTQTLLGFLATTGFKQTVLVSHEDAAEAVADQLITL